MPDAIRYDGGLTVSLPVASLDAAIDWYQNILGFELQYRMDDMGWCELVTPVAGVNVGLSQVEAPNPGGATPTFGVANISEAKAALESRDVKIDGDIVIIENMVKLLTFYDPDDNALMFFELLASDD